jgi:hypothetical protein
MPRPESQINLEELEKLCAIQCTDQEIAAYFGVSTRTIERRRKVLGFQEVMERGRAKGRVSVRRQLFKLADNGNLGATIFLAKNLLGYKDRLATEHSGPAGGPMEVSLADVLRERQRQETGDRSQESGVRRQESGDRRQESGVRSGKGEGGGTE